VEANDHSVFLVEGNLENIKITSPIDLIVGESLTAK
jgi:2-C-methyl-D-erythritol 4-phosphate cytidylyltransferase